MNCGTEATLNWLAQGSQVKRLAKSGVSELEEPCANMGQAEAVVVCAFHSKHFNDVTSDPAQNEYSRTGELITNHIFT